MKTQSITKQVKKLMETQNIITVENNSDEDLEHYKVSQICNEDLKYYNSRTKYKTLNCRTTLMKIQKITLAGHNADEDLKLQNKH